MIEQERTFVARSLPCDLISYPMETIMDVYILGADGMAQIRARKKWEHYQLTKKVPIKTNDVSIQEEINITINKDEFDYLYTYLPCIIHKDRYQYHKDGYLYEIDIFHWILSGLVLIDVEFATEQAMRDFSAPDFLWKEVTQDRQFAWGILCQASEKKAKKLIQSMYLV